jgi:hypothetical protein
MTVSQLWELRFNRKVFRSFGVEMSLTTLRQADESMRNDTYQTLSSYSKPLATALGIYEASVGKEANNAVKGFCA